MKNLIRRELSKKITKWSASYYYYGDKRYGNFDVKKRDVAKKKHKRYLRWYKWWIKHIGW